MTRRIAIVAMLILVLGNQACNSDPKNADQVDYQPAACGSPDHALTLAEHLTEADTTFLDRLNELDPSVLPPVYNTEALFELDRSLIAYMSHSFQQLPRCTPGAGARALHSLAWGPTPIPGWSSTKTCVGALSFP